MASIIIRLFAIMICAFYTFSKLINSINRSFFQNMTDLLLCVLISVTASFMGRVYPVLVIPLVITFTVIYLSLIKKISIELTITTVIISYGISYSLYTFIVIVISFVLGFSNLNKAVDFIYPSIVTALLLLILMQIPFRFKRLKKGMPFLISNGGTNAGVMISVILLCGVMVLFNNSREFIYVIPYVTILICAALVILWWRNNIKKLYIGRQKEKELQILQDSLTEKENRIQYLEKQNSELAKIIHKDNKLIPAMELAVKTFLQETKISDPVTLCNKGRELLNHLEEMSRERSGIVSLYQAQNKQLPLTNVASIDALLAYMLSKSTSNSTAFDFTVSGSIKYMIDNIICEPDLNTLLADLIENALIAAKNCLAKKILVNLGIVDNVYVISIYDSGEPFSSDVLLNLGRKKITTHSNEGGSGIGLMTLYEIITGYNASFIIDELISHSSGYTKQVTIKFDRQNQFVINTPDINKAEPLNNQYLASPLLT